jgi:hypothetical protein
MDNKEADKIRLSDRILSALQLSLVQEDVKVSESLIRALELSMTRNSGGGEFIERRDYPAEMEAAMFQFSAIKDKCNAV